MSAAAEVLDARLGARHSVLVVDDEELNRHLYGALLSSAGYEVEVAVDGEDAIRRLSTSRPDVVLLDFRMPLIDGPGVLTWMRSSLSHKDTPVVLLTASGEAEHVSAAFDAGADDYLLKPVNSRILLARVSSTIRARETSRRMVDAERREKHDEEVRTRLITDLEDARQVQLSQIPTFPLHSADLWYSGCVVSSGHVGGDLLDVVDVGDTTIALLVDVAGHGTGAALVASSIRTELRFLLASFPLEEAIVRLGRRILADGSRHVCVALVAMRDGAFAIVNAGLPPVWVGNAIEPRLLIASSGPPPGLFETESYEVTHGVLRPGETIAVVSDGLTEPFGYADEIDRNIPPLLVERSGGIVPGPSALAKAIERVFAAHGVEERPDDATVLMIGRRS